MKYMISTPKSVPELLRESIPDVLPGKHPIRLLACGVPKGVESVVRQLYVVRFAQSERMESAFAIACQR